MLALIKAILLFSINGPCCLQNEKSKDAILARINEPMSTTVAPTSLSALISMCFWGAGIIGICSIPLATGGSTGGREGGVGSGASSICNSSVSVRICSALFVSTNLSSLDASSNNHVCPSGFVAKFLK